MIDNTTQKWKGSIFQAICWLGLILAVLAALKVNIACPDLWWHLASGREMIENHIFLRTDIFSHTLYGTQWINFEWGSQIFFYWIYEAFGYWGFFWTQYIIGLAVWFLAIQIARAAGLRDPILFLMAGISFKLLQPRLMFRPEIWSLLFLAATLLWVLKIRNKTPNNSLISLGLLFALAVLWINFHAGFIYGLGLLVLLRLGAQFSEEDPKFVRLLEKAIVLFLVAFLINPHGPFIAGVLVDHLFQLKANMALIQEWNVPRAHVAPYFWGVFVLTGGLFIRYFLSPGRRGLLWGPAVAVFSLWGAMSFRNIFFLGLIFPPFLSQTLSWENIKIKSRRWWSAGLWTVGISVAIFSIADYRRFPRNPVAWRLFPVQACDFLEEKNIQGVMYNTYGFGGFLEWRFGPSRPVFIDGRYSFQPFLVEMDQLEKKMTINLNKNGWREFLNRHHVDYAVVDYWGETRKFIFKELPFPLTLYNGVFPREDWALVHWDDTGMVFLKRIPKFLSLIKNHEFVHLRPFNLEQIKVLVDNKLIPEKELAEELRRHSKEVEISLRRQKIENLFQRRSQ